MGSVIKMTEAAKASYKKALASFIKALDAAGAAYCAHMDAAEIAYIKALYAVDAAQEAAYPAYLAAVDAAAAAYDAAQEAAYEAHTDAAPYAIYKKAVEAAKEAEKAIFDPGVSRR